MLFRKRMDRYCTYCKFAGKINQDQVICQKWGIVPANHKCRRFRYDPLKRVPAKNTSSDFSKYNTKDFSL